jgi:hypothetical protein
MCYSSLLKNLARNFAVAAPSRSSLGYDLVLHFFW